MGMGCVHMMLERSLFIGLLLDLLLVFFMVSHQKRVSSEEEEETIPIESILVKKTVEDTHV